MCTLHPWTLDVDVPERDKITPHDWTNDELRAGRGLEAGHVNMQIKPGFAHTMRPSLYFSGIMIVRYKFARRDCLHKRAML